MLQVNLLPWRNQDRQKRKRFWVYQTAAVLMLSLLVLGGWWGVVQRDVAEQKKTATYWAAQHMRLGTQLKKVDEARAQLQSLQSAANQRQQRHEKSVAYLRLLNALSQHIPDTVWLTQVTEDANGVLRLQGESTIYHSVMAFVHGLKQELSIGDVRLLDMQRQPNHNVQFFIRLRLANTSQH